MARMDGQRVNLYLPKAFVARLDKYAQENFMSRTGALISCVSNFLDQKDAVKMTPAVMAQADEVLKAVNSLGGYEQLKL